ncbi:hypothetical protein OA387_04420, partial [Prochlorococcus sp. AH-716-M10]|nr:hypothetical protein [Prochlorococcus sp. AH-716-M10]
SLITEALNDGYQYAIIGNIHFNSNNKYQNFDELFINIVGNGIIFRYREENNIISLIPTMGSSGIYFHKINNQIHLFINEKSAYMNLISNTEFILNQNEYISSLISHQLCWNSPMGTLEKNLNYLSTGLRLNISKNANFKIDLYLKNALDSYKKYSRRRSLSDELYNVIGSYYALCKGELRLLYSGGIDSSLLWKIIYKSDPKVKCLNYLYPSPTISNNEKNKSNELLMLQNVGSKLKVNLVENKPDLKINSKVIFKCCEKSQRCLISIYQLRLSSIFFNSNRSKSKTTDYLISGQNADTIHSIDTYAPSTEVIFPVRQLMNILAILRRIKYHFIFIKILKIFPKKNNIFLKLTNINSLAEHKNKSSNYLINIDEDFKDDFFKNREYLFNIANFISEDSKEFLKQCNPELSVRINRHFRTIQNSIRTFNDYSYYSNNEEKKMPFVESPVYLYLLSLKRGLLDLIIPKRMIYSAFKRLFKFRYRKLMPKSTIKSTFNIINDIYTAKKKQSLKYSEEDFIALYELIKFTNSQYEFRKSKANKILIEIKSNKISIELKMILNTLSKISTIYKKDAITELKFLVEKFSDKLILRIINLHIYINSIFKEEVN